MDRSMYSASMVSLQSAKFHLSTKHSVPGKCPLLDNHPCTTFEGRDQCTCTCSKISMQAEIVLHTNDTHDIVRLSSHGHLFIRDIVVYTCTYHMLQFFLSGISHGSTVVGVYVNNQGQRSRKQELIWHSPPSYFGEFNFKKNHRKCDIWLCVCFCTTVYKEPYLLVYCESGLEVYDITTAKWTQTLPIRKVCL